MLPSDEGPCGFYRVIQPLELLELHGKIQLERYALPDGRPAITTDLMRECDVTILQRVGAQPPVSNPTPNQEHALYFARDVWKYGHKIVYEIDDDLENVVTNDPDFQDTAAHRARAHATRELMRSCRIVTTTTYEAAKRLESIHKTRRVVPNGLDLELWRPPGYTPRCDETEAQTGGEVRIAYAASKYHVDDVRLLINPFKAMAAAHPNVRFVFAGGRYPVLLDALGDRAEHVGEVGMGSWPEFARSLRADIWVAPLVDSRFARSKSNLKWLEATAVGAAVVASDVVTYNRGPVGEPWFVPPMGLARSSMEWMIALEHLIVSAQLRRDLVRRSFGLLGQHYTAQHTADAWMRVIEEVCAA